MCALQSPPTRARFTMMTIRSDVRNARVNHYTICIIQWNLLIPNLFRYWNFVRYLEVTTVQKGFNLQCDKLNISHISIIISIFIHYNNGVHTYMEVHIWIYWTCCYFVMYKFILKKLTKKQIIFMKTISFQLDVQEL